MSAAITPGPWVIYGLKSRGGVLTIASAGPSGPDRHICRMSWARDEGGLADAKAIAAVPKMVEALIAARPIIAEDADLFGEGSHAADILAQLDEALKLAGIEL